MTAWILAWCFILLNSFERKKQKNKIEDEHSNKSTRKYRSRVYFQTDLYKFGHNNKIKFIMKSQRIQSFKLTYLILKTETGFILSPSV